LRPELQKFAGSPGAILANGSRRVTRLFPQVVGALSVGAESCGRRRDFGIAIAFSLGVNAVATAAADTNA
jgi:hypothetical protein